MEDYNLKEAFKKMKKFKEFSDKMSIDGLKDSSTKLTDFSPKKVEKECSVCGRKFSILEYSILSNEEDDKCLFHSNKSDKKWNDATSVWIVFFWEKIREEMELQNDSNEYNFSDFIFPAFESVDNDGTINFFLNKDNKEFTKSVDFTNAKFVEFADFSKVVFKGRSLFCGTHFYGHVTFSGADFSKCGRNNYISFMNSLFGIKEKDNTDDRFRNAVIFKDIKVNSQTSFEFKGAVFYSEFQFIGSEDNFVVFSNIDFLDTHFYNKFKLQFCEVNDAIFFNTRFHKLADFYKTKFNKVNFEMADFNSVSVFNETHFQDVNFKYTKFIGQAMFRDMKVDGQLNLRESIFYEKANFLGVSKINNKERIEVENRETARIVKEHLEEQKNIIEANKYYALEMEKQEEELEKDGIFKNFSEWLVFKFHKISSNHSQDWVLALFWIFNITMFYGLSSYLCKCGYFPTDTIFGTFGFILACLIIILILLIIFLVSEHSIFKNRWYLFFISIFLYFIYAIITGDFLLSELSKNINPFSIMDSNYNISFGTLIYRIVIAYLIYQVIVSVRQNTRRN